MQIKKIHNLSTLLDGRSEVRKRLLRFPASLNRQVNKISQPNYGHEFFFILYYVFTDFSCQKISYYMHFCVTFSIEVFLVLFRIKSLTYL